MVLKPGHFWKYIRNEWKVLKFDKGEGWRSFGPIMWKIKEYYIQSCKKKHPTQCEIKEG
jgi:hypothetical protein